MIGLVDYDLQTSTSTSRLIPNLEIMKLATYYKIEQKTFCRLVSLTETDLNIYDSIYFFSETSINPKVPPQFLKASNIIYGGSSFTNNIYQPFQNELIDYTIPRPNIYKQFLQTKYQDGIKTKVLAQVLDDSYYRMFAGNNKLPIPPIRAKKHVYLYDTDIFKQDWEKILGAISEQHPACIIPIHPIICHTLSKYFTLRRLSKIARKALIILDINIPYNQIYYMFKKYKKQFLADVNISSDICITLGGSYFSTFQYFNDFIYKMNLLYCFWSNNIPIRIIYSQPKIGYTDPLNNISKLIYMWTHGNNLFLTQTLTQRMNHRLSKEKIQKLVQQQELLFKFHPSAKDLFNHNYKELAQRGVWRI